MNKGLSATFVRFEHTASLKAVEQLATELDIRDAFAGESSDRPDRRGNGRLTRAEVSQGRTLTW